MKEPEENQDIDDVFRKRFKEFTAEPKRNDRDQIFRQLDNTQTTKKFAWKYAIAASLVLAFFSFILIDYLIHRKPEKISIAGNEKRMEEKTVKIVPKEPKKNIAGIHANEAKDFRNKISAVKNENGKKNSIKSSSQILVLQNIPEQSHGKFFLPDSSQLTLEGQSTLKYYDNFLQERIVKLIGDATFSVLKKSGMHFKVVSATSVIEVLGTIFTVHASETGIQRISVKEGKVWFYRSDKKGERIVLTRGETGFLNSSGMPEKSLLPDSSKSTTPKDLKWLNTPLSAIIQDLTAAFSEPIKVSNQDVLKCTFSGSFSHPKNIEELLDVITVALGLSYTHQNGKIEIKGKGCK